MSATRLSLNSATLPMLELPELLETAAALDLPAVGIWRSLLEPRPLATSAALVEASGLAVSTVCRAGLFTARDRRRDDDLRALDEAAALGAGALVVVAGGSLGMPLPDARAIVRDGLAELAADAAERGVRLALEPMHPMMVRARSTVASLAEANDLIADLPGVDLAYDAYHLWWDARLEQETARGSGRIAAVQIADWIDVPDGVLDSRGFPGEGSIDLDRVLGFAAAAGYDGFVEIEVLSKRWQDAGPDASVAALERSLRLLRAA